MNIKQIATHAAQLSGILLLATGCGSATSPDNTTASSAEETPPILADAFAAVPRPATMPPIHELRTQAQPGDDVVVEGKIMGVMKPFVENRALFVLGDEDIITSCDLLGDDDHCDTPWDACCEDPKNLRAGTISIQVVDANGHVLRHAIRGVNNLAELSRVRVAGTVSEHSTTDAFIVNARAIEVL
jgi:hypothetical protein